MILCRMCEKKNTHTKRLEASYSTVEFGRIFKYLSCALNFVYNYPFEMALEIRFISGFQNTHLFRANPLPANYSSLFYTAKLFYS